MKRRFSKILGVGLTLALLASLLMTAAPVSALSQPVVTFVADHDVISKVDANYIISFRVDEQLVPTDKICVTFPEGTTVDATPTATIKAWILDGGVTLKEDFVDAEVASRVGDTLEVELTWSNDTITTLGTVAVTFTAGIDNPDTARTDYSLTVGTQETDDDVIEAAVTSADYEITVPTIEVLPGIVQQYNAVDILMAQDTGDDAINTLVGTAGEDYTIVVGPGEYEITATIDLDEAGVTLKSSAGADDTIIKAGTGLTSHLILISAAEGTVDGFTIGDVYAYHHGISIQGNDAIVKDNIITAEPTEIGIFINASGATVTGNELDEDCTMYLCAVSDSTISDNIFGECLNLYPGSLAIDGLTVTDNTMIGSLAQAIDFSGTGTFSDILIEGNIISEAAGTAAIQIRDAANVTNLQILDNEITDNEGDGILIQGASVGTGNVIKFNTITGNDTSTGDYGIQNDAGTDVVDATFNWWGTTVAADIADMVSGTGDVTTDPFLTDTVDAVFSLSDATTGTSLDAKTTVGVRVEGVASATTISAARYIANPQEALADVIAFFDVYVANGGATDAVTLKFYVGDANSEVYIWSADTETWGAVTPVDFSTYGGFVSVTVMADVLGGTPFALVVGAAAAIDAPTSLVPTSGADDVSLKPTLAWGMVADAIGYDFELAGNANFVLPIVSLTGDVGRLIAPFYAQVTPLEYSTYYYWRVKAVSADGESAWSPAVFYTVAEVIPEPEVPPVWTCPQCGLDFATRDALAAHAATAHPAVEPPEIVIESPDIIVPLPAETPITPAWIYVIIAVGGVLVIGLIVLIVRTRRVA